LRNRRGCVKKGCCFYFRDQHATFSKLSLYSEPSQYRPIDAMVRNPQSNVE
jgi:hypothetical protein